MRKLYASPSKLLALSKPQSTRPGICHSFKSCEMQSIKTLLRPLFLLLVGLVALLNTEAQTTISTNFTNNNGNALVTFNFRNNNAGPVMITDMASITQSSGDKIVSVFYKTTPINGAPGAISAANGWLLAASATPNIAVSGSVVPMISNIGLVVPGGATYGIAFQVLTSSGGTSLSYSTLTAGTYTFSGGGCDLISGTSVSYGGGVAPASPTFTPRGFIGSVTFVPFTTCSGTPNPGNTLISVTAACPGANFTLSLQNGLPQVGLSFQWQSAASAAGPWNNITGATGNTYQAAQTSTTFYRCMLTCSGSSANSNPVQVTMNLPTNCYCAAGAGTTAGEKISRVRYLLIDNASTSTAGYENFLNVTTPAFLGVTSPITVNISGAFTSDQVLVWIDFNQNGSFSDAGELVYTSATGVGPHTGNITVPATAMMGNTRMRVRLHDTGPGPNNTPCGNSSWGQVEDYTVNIQTCIPATISTQPASTNTLCGGNASFSITAAGSIPAYGWQFRTSASAPWQDVANGGVYSGATTNTLVITSATSAMNGYQYRALLTGACAALDYSQPATLTVTPPTPVVNPASASICNGTIQSLTLTNSVSAPTTGIFVASAGLPLAIPDNTPTGTTASVAVSGIPAGVLITNVAVKFTMTHTWVGDLIMNLRAPNGQVLNLIGLLNNGAGNNDTDNFTNTVVDSLSTTSMSGAPAPRTGTYRADRFGVGTNLNPIATTTGFWAPLLTTLNGNWTLGLSDLGPGDLGNLLSWEIQISYVAPVFAQGTWTASPASPNTMFTDAAATIPYTGTPATTIYVKPTVNTNYSVSFTTPTPCQSAIATIPVNVTNPVVGLVVAPATRAVCLGGSTTFNASVTSGGPITYQWERSIDGGLTYSAITGATSATLTISGVTQNMTGYRYRVVATAAPCGSVTSNVATLTVNALPVVTISAPAVRLVPGRTTTITATSTPPAAPNGWSWTYNGGAIPGTTNTQLVNIDQLGSYQATVVDVNGCTNKSNSLVISAEATDKLWIYPNPTVNGAFQVRLYFAGDLAEKRVVTIYNPLGQVIESRDFTLVRGSAPYQRMDFNLGGGATAKGAYVVKVAHQYTGKVISGIILVQ